MVIADGKKTGFAASKLSQTIFAVDERTPMGSKDSFLASSKFMVLERTFPVTYGPLWLWSLFCAKEIEVSLFYLRSVVGTMRPFLIIVSDDLSVASTTSNGTWVHKFSP